MEDIFHSLRLILLNSVPTFCFLLFLVIYLRAMYFQPFAKILKQRYEATEGAKKAAEESLRQAELRVAEYEEKLRAAAKPGAYPIHSATSAAIHPKPQERAS